MTGWTTHKPTHAPHTQGHVQVHVTGGGGYSRGLGRPYNVQGLGQGGSQGRLGVQGGLQSTTQRHTHGLLSLATELGGAGGREVQRGVQRRVDGVTGVGGEEGSQ
jgi:hypothetical protein